MLLAKQLPGRPVDQASAGFYGRARVGDHGGHQLMVGDYRKTACNPAVGGELLDTVQHPTVFCGSCNGADGG